MLAAQGIQPAPQSPTATRQATSLKPVPSPASAPPSSAAPIPSGLGQRAQPAPIPQQGPSRPASLAPATTAPATTPTPAKVYDRGGRLIPGAVQVGPNRVLDTRSGRYHSTVPSGDGQRIDD